MTSATSPASEPGPEDQVPLDQPSQDAAAGGALLAEFLRAVGHQLGPAGLTPSALARAVAQLLPVDAAGITTMVDVLRLPLGASTGTADRAEALQSTLGEGPCLWAAETRTAGVVEQAEMLRRWPLYAEELLAQTPFRSVATVPLASPNGEVFAALDVYAEDSQLSERLNLDEIVDQIAVPLAALLSTCIPTALDGAHHSGSGGDQDADLARTRRPAGTAAPPPDDTPSGSRSA